MHELFTMCKPWSGDVDRSAPLQGQAPIKLPQLPPPARQADVIDGAHGLEQIVRIGLMLLVDCIKYLAHNR